MPIIHHPRHVSIRITAVFSIFNTVHNSLIETFYPQKPRKAFPIVRSTTHECIYKTCNFGQSAN